MHDVVIVGAGPYGLSAAAHLRQIKGLDLKVFGEPMSFWERHMPSKMLLRSWRPASHIADPENRLSLDAYRAVNGNHGLQDPLPVGDFIKYGHWFHQHGSVQSDRRNVVCIEPVSDGYQLTLEDGEILPTKRVVVATGIQSFTHRPPAFDDLPDSLVTHSSDKHEYEKFRGKEVLVIGGGQSSLESAAFLVAAGARVEILIRSQSIAARAQRACSELCNSGPVSRGGWLRSQRWVNMFHARADVGPPGLSLIIQRPNLFRRLPRYTKDWSDRRAIRPVFSYKYVVDKKVMPILASRFVARVQAQGERLCVELNDGTERSVDHVILATGYRVDVARYSFLSPRILQGLETVDGYPRVDSGFETSLPGLHFLGAPAAWSFGPLVRFIAGTEFTSRALTRRIRGAKKR
jgi:thioredoxin reductase